MKLSTVLSLVPTLLLALGGAAALAQDAPGPAPSEPDSAAVEAAEEALDYSDYTVKAYSLNVFGGSFTGATYLDMPERWPKTEVAIGIGDNLGPADVRGYDGHPLVVARQLGIVNGQANKLVYDAVQKKIESGPAYGARIGVYISDDFHLDIVGAYAKGKAVTSMLYVGDTKPDQGLVNNTRYVVDEDDGFTMYRGGLTLNYDARPATFFGLEPRIGFGLGGIINRFTMLEDNTSLYLEGTAGLTKRFGERLSVNLAADVVNFAFDVEELGYRNMVNYATFSLGVSWFIDVLPHEVRAKHIAAQEAAEE